MGIARRERRDAEGFITRARRHEMILEIRFLILEVWKEVYDEH